MPTYIWRAIDKNGKNKKGIEEADSIKSLQQKLNLDNLYPTKITLTDKTINNKTKSKSYIKKLSSKDLITITKQFATLLKAGLTINASLKAMVAQTKKSQQKQLLNNINAKINEGFTFAQTLETLPHIFPNYYVSTITAGEKTGAIHKILSRLGDYLQSSYDTKQKIGLALLYPGIIVMVALGVIIAMLTVVVPSIVEVFANSGQSLPWLTVALIAISDFITTWGGIFLIFLGIGLLIFKRLLKRENIQYAFHKILLKIPFYGKLLLVQNTARFIRTLGILLESKVDFYESMKIASNVINLLPIKLSLTNATKMIQEGSSVFVALTKTGYFSPITLNLIASGEKSGALPEMLYQSAENQDQDTINTINLFVGIFEPMVILLMGGVVLIIVMAILVPIFDMNNMVQ